MKQPISKRRLKKIVEVVNNRQSGFIVVLEDIHDPHNAAAILRTCDAFGIQNVWFVFEKEKPYNPRKVGKSSSSSANKWLDYKIFDSTKKCYAELKRKKYTIIATALTPGAQNLYQSELEHSRIALVIGNEHRGLSDYAINNASVIIHVPMRGMVQSLNASVTAALFMAEITRQRIGTKTALSKSEQKKLLASFSKR